MTKSNKQIVYGVVVTIIGVLLVATILWVTNDIIGATAWPLLVK